jgi:UPF0176 protein
MRIEIGASSAYSMLLKVNGYMTENDRILVAALYRFAQLPDHAAMRGRLLAICRRNGVFGTLLLADEGINGTIGGPPAGIRAVLDYLRADPRLTDLEHKESWCYENPFYRMKVRLKREIVTLGLEGVDPVRDAGTHVNPADWNALIGDPGTVIIDTRNDYETAIGRFRGALDPHTTNFRDFPAWLEQNTSRLEGAERISMYCTGGIRCEKATAYLKSQGYEDVYHLKGGILKYLETVPEAESAWEGECFVFDNRVSVGQGLAQGSYDLCHACRHPISAADKASACYEPGVSCPHCHAKTSESQRARFAARQKQIGLAKMRGEAHIAADFDAAKKRKRRQGK